jgi:hypothetical protein
VIYLSIISGRFGTGGGKAGVVAGLILGVIAEILGVLTLRKRNRV